MAKPIQQLLTAARKILIGAVPFVVGLAALVAIIAWLAGAFEEKIAPGSAPATVKTLTDQPTDVVHEIFKDYVEEAVGTLKAASRSVISSKLLATINEITVSAGDVVSKDDVLVRLDAQEFEARLNQSREALSAATARKVSARQEFDRAEKLVATRAISRQDYDQAQQNLEVAQAEERRAQQAVTEATVLLSYTTIDAPKAGRIVDRDAEPGDTARPGMPLLVLYDATSLRLEAPVLEHLAVRLEIGQALEVYVDSLDKEFDAVIDEIVPQADAPSRSFLVKVSLPSSAGLYEGMFGRLRIPSGTRRHLCLATDAIERVGQLEFVEIVGEDDTIERRFITTGRLGVPGRVEVLSGVEAGERVVLKGATSS